MSSNNTSEKKREPQTLDDILNGNVQSTAPLTLEQIVDDFVNKKKDFKNGEEDWFSSLGGVARLLINEYQERNFAFVDFCNLANHLDLPFEKLSVFFYKLILALKAAKRINVIEIDQSAYNYKSYQLIK